MKKMLCAGLFLAGFCLNHYDSLAQDNVGIGTANPRSTALLDLNSNNRGLLLPRVDRTAMTLGALDHGMVVFDTVSNALFIWDGTAFQTLALASDFWSITGNSGTTDGVNFIGNTDNVPLNFRVNNVSAGRLTSAGVTIYGVQAGLNNSAITTTAIGFRALGTNTTGINNTAVGYGALTTNTGERNTAIGTNTLTNNTSGDNNTGVGDRVLNANTTGQGNTGIGLTALFSNTIGQRNAAVGFDALFSNTQGNDNVAVGYRAGFTNTTGFGNVFLGENADASTNNLFNAIAIGSGATVSQSNSMILGNNVNVGIGTSVPQNRLDVAGGVVIGSAYSGSNTAPTNGIRVEGGIVSGTTSNTYGGAYGLHIHYPGTASLGKYSTTATGSGINDGLSIGYVDAFGAVLMVTEVAGLRFGTNSSYHSITDASGNWGLGTLTPFNRLDVEGSAVVGSGYSGASAAPTNGMLVEGNVGIGNNNPSTRLEVRGISPLNGNGIIEAYHDSNWGFGVLSSSSSGGDNTGTLYTRAMMAGIDANPTGSNNIGTWGHVFGTGSGGWGVIASNGASESAPDRYVALAGSSGFPYAGIFMGGDVGIGINAPTSTLHVVDPSPGVGNGLIQSHHTSGFGYGVFASSSSGGNNSGTVYTHARIAGYEANPMGTTNVGVWGHQFGTGVGGWGVIASNGASLTSPSTYAALASNSAYSAVFMGGRVGIGTTAPTSDLQIVQSGGVGSNEGTGGIDFANSIYRWRVYNSQNFLRFNYSANSGGSYTPMAYVNPGTGAWVVVSDGSRKTQISDLPGVLDKVMMVQPRKYHYKHQEADDKMVFGVIAQELNEVFPEMVSKEEEVGDIYGVDYSMFGVIAIKAIQELKKENEELKARIQALEEK